VPQPTFFFLEVLYYTGLFRIPTGTANTVRNPVGKIFRDQNPWADMQK
jgi:hypothetical protein